MTESAAHRVPKWPFVVGDVCLLLLAYAIMRLSEHPLGLWQSLACLSAVAFGGFLCAWPFVLEHTATGRLSEAQRLAGAVIQLQQLEQLAAQITGATARWQTAQDAAEKTATAAKAIADKIDGEARAFQQFLEKNNEGERRHLRLEVEKLQRTQGEWLQITVHTLDHIFALHQAGLRSNQPNLAAQLEQFQNTCRDLARRLGLVAFAPPAGEAFAEAAHQLADLKAKAPEGATVADTLAPGYTFQGQLLRKAVVTLQTEPIVGSEEPSPPAHGAAGVAVTKS